MASGQTKRRVVKVTLRIWSRRRDLNPRPYGPEPYALPTALRLVIVLILYAYLLFQSIKLLYGCKKFSFIRIKLAMPMPYFLYAGKV